MKKVVVCILMLVLLLSGCSGATNGSDNSQNINFNQFKEAPEDSIALMVNLPSPEQISLLNIDEIFISYNGKDGNPNLEYILK